MLFLTHGDQCSISLREMTRCLEKNNALLFPTRLTRMCRMLMLKGDYSTDLPMIFEALKDASLDDWVYQDVYGKHISHDDGWGYVSINEESIRYDRIYKPVFDCDLPNLPDHGTLIIHARKAADGEPLGPLNCHPHHRSDPLLDVYLSHNGAFDKRKIGDSLGVDAIDWQTDSEFFLQLLMSRSGSIIVKLTASIADMKKMDLVKTTGNIFLAYNDKMKAENGGYYFSTSKKPSAYSTLYRVKAPAWVGVFSSTIIKSRNFPKDYETEEVPMDMLFHL